jgi:hypothetical protein
MSTVLTQLKKLFNSLFYAPTAIEQYVASKNPKTAAEVDFWIRQFDASKYRGL